MTDKTKRERGSGSLYMHGKTWWTKVYYNGKPDRESTGESDYKKARKILQKRAGDAAKGIVPDSRGLKYENLRDSYLSDAQANGLKSLRKDTDGAVYLESVRRLDEFFSGWRAVDITVDVIREYRQSELEKGRKNGTVNRSLASLRRMFALAQEDGRLHNAPFFKMLPEARPRQGTLPQEKYPLLLAALPDYLRPILAIGHATGMRLGEILGLTWANINFLDSIIRIEDSKNGEAREIPFSGELETMLRKQHAKRQPGCDFVCYRLDRRGHAVRIGNFRKPWRRCVKALQLGSVEKGVYTPLIFHDLRRQFVTDAEHAGVPRHEAMKMSGHKSESVYRRYAIGNLESRRTALGLIEEYRAGKIRVRAQDGHNSANFGEHPAKPESVIN